jgi:hypothetical protein
VTTWLQKDWILRKVRPIETESVYLEKSKPTERGDLEKSEVHGDRKSGS